MIRKICGWLGNFIQVIMIIFIFCVPVIGAIFTMIVTGFMFGEIYEWEPIEVLPIMLLSFGLHLGLTYLIINNIK